MPAAMQVKDKLSVLLLVVLVGKTIKSTAPNVAQINNYKQ